MAPAMSVLRDLKLSGVRREREVSRRRSHGLRRRRNRTREGRGGSGTCEREQADVMRPTSVRR